MHCAQRVEGVDDCNAGDVLALIITHTHSFCTTFFVILLITGEKSELEEYSYNLSER